jgi:CubicO group peptidase (beta-lactamase class C family)
MKSMHRLRPSTSLVLLSAWLGAGTFAQDVQPARLAPVLQPFVESNTLAGAVVLVADKHRVLSVEAVGWADIGAKKPMRTDSVFWIASQSKPITGVALMILVDEGKVNVDDPVEKYLPEFGGQQVNVSPDPGKPELKAPRHPILVREVLSHTSGLDFKSGMETPTLDLQPLAERVRSYAKMALIFEPGTKSKYSNAGINTAGRIVEVVSGMSFEKFLEERIFKPLGMTDTTFYPSKAQIERLAKSYKPNAAKDGLEEITIGQLKYPLDDPQRGPMPAGGLFSTAKDMSLFYRMMANDGILNGKRILSEKAVQMATSDQSGEAKSNYGFGFGTDGKSFTHGGAYNTQSAYDRERKLITVFLVQHAAFSEAGKDIRSKFNQAARAFAGAKPENPSPADDAQLVVGIPGETQPGKPPMSRPATAENFIVYKEPGRYGGWPANHGLWQWGDELVVGFDSTWYKQTTTDHRIDRTKPMYAYQARSLDGGRTWKTESDLPFADPTKVPKPAPLTEPLDFTAPDFSLLFRFGGLHAGPSWFYTSADRCKTWQGPYSFAVEGIDRICTRTDLIVLGPRDCLMFGSCAKQNDSKEGRVFCARTTDGGINWKLVSLIGPEPQPGAYAIMPSSLQLKDGAILTTIRRSDPGVSGFIEAWRSEDSGKTWKLLGKPASGMGGNPPALVQLNDGRLAMTYGFRHKPSGMRACISADGGRSWGPEILLRDGAFDGDMGYPRSIVRPDGKVLTIYYFNGPQEDDRAIEATLWTAPGATSAATSVPAAPVIVNAGGGM